MLPAWVKPIVVEYPPHGGNDYLDLLNVVSHAVRDAGEYWVLGWSFSGPLALMLAAREPRRIRGVILCASFVRPPRPNLAWCRFAAVGPVIWLIRAARRLPIFLSTDRESDIRRDKAETWARVSAWTLAARVRAVLRVDARDMLRQCEAPIVYLASSRDAIVSRWNADEIALLLPSSRRITIDGPHMALYTDPRAAADAICRVLEADASCGCEPTVTPLLAARRV